MAKSVYQILIELEGDKAAKGALEDLGKAAGLSGAALSAFAAGAGKLAADYEKTLGDVSIVIDEQTGSTESLSQALFDLQESTGGIINVQQAAAASAELLSSGIKGQDTILNALESSQKAAIAGQSDLNTISAAAAGVVNAYGDALGNGLSQGEKFNKVVDLILQTQIDGVITADQYARSIGQIASLANIAGISLEELNGSIALSTEKGTPASIAFNNLKSAISNITAPTAMAKEEAKALGIEFDAARLKSVGLQQIVTDIFASENFDEASLGKLFGSTEAQSVISQLGSDLDGLTEKVNNQANGIGALDIAYGKVDDTVSQRVTNTLNKLQASLIKIGQGVLIAFEPVLNLVAELANVLGGLPTPVLQAVGAVTALGGVTLTASGAVLLLATSAGAVNGALSTGLPLLISFVKGVSALAASALSGSVGFKNLNLGLLATNAQLNILAVKGKAAIATLAPIALLGAAIAGAAASVALVADSFQKTGVASEKSKDALKEYRDTLVDIQEKTGELEGPELNLTKSQQELEKLKEEVGSAQRALDLLRGPLPGFETSVEIATDKASLAFAEVAEETNKVEDSIRGLFQFSENGELLPKESLGADQIQAEVEKIDAALTLLSQSRPVSPEDIASRDRQIEQLNKFKNALTVTTSGQKENQTVTKQQTQTVEEAAKAYDQYAKSVQDSVDRIDQQTENSIAALTGSEVEKINQTLALRESATQRQIALLENLKNQEGTTAQERLSIETDIQTRKQKLNTERLEANKALEEQYTESLRASQKIRETEFQISLEAENQTISDSYDKRLELINQAFNLESGLIAEKLKTVTEGSTEEKVLISELKDLELQRIQDINELDAQVAEERLQRIQDRTQAQKDALDLEIQGQEILSQISANSSNVLESWAGILNEISGLLEGDNVTLSQRAELLKLAEAITGKTFQTNGNSSALDQAKIAIQNQLNQIEIQKLDLKVQQLEIDKEQLRIANEIRQIEISGRREEISSELQRTNLTQPERERLQRESSNLARQSELENQKARIGTEGIDNQIGFAGIERRLAEIVASGSVLGRSPNTAGNITREGSSSQQIRSEAQSAFNKGTISSEELKEALDRAQEIDDENQKKLEDRAKKEEEDRKAQAELDEKSLSQSEALLQTSEVGAELVSQNTEELQNVAGSVNTLISVAESQLQIQQRIATRLDQMARSLDSLPNAIAARLPRSSPQVPPRR